MLGWLRHSLFSSRLDTLLTLVVLGTLGMVAWRLYQWGVADAVWVANTRRECLDRSPYGACWAGVVHWFSAFIYGRYPAAARWRVDLAFVTLVVWIAPLWLPRVKKKPFLGTTAVLLYPPLAYYLLAGGSRGWIMQAILALGLSVLILNMAHAASCLGTGRGLAERLPRMSRRTDSARARRCVLAGICLVLQLTLMIGLWDFDLVQVRTIRWGGLFLTLVIAVAGMALSLPCGVLLALGRRSRMPLIRALVIAYIELLRSVPLVGVLFMAVTMVPLFLPEGLHPDKLAMAMGAISAFAAAYMAEVVRGGIQAIPAGQFDAAAAIGLGYWHMMRLVVLPQALKHMIPNIASNFIGLLKDTSLVALVGLLDFTLMLRAPGSTPTWIGLHIETFVLGGVVYFALCYSISRYSQHLEKTLAGSAAAPNARRSAW